MRTLLQDLRYAARALRASPGFTLVAALTLALGVGANTAIFSVVDAVLLRPLPFADPDRLVMVWERNLSADHGRNVLSPADFLAWRDEARSFESLAASVELPVVLGSGGEDPESVRQRVASPEIFALLGVRPAAGRLLAAADERLDAPPVAVLAYGLWQRRFGGRSGIVGSVIRLDGEPYTVAGVLPRGFRYLDEDVDVWRPLRFEPQERAFGGRFLRVVGRLKPGVTPAAASGEMAALAARRAHDVPATNANWTAYTVPLQEDLVQPSRLPLVLLLAAVSFLLAIACANVAGLLLARASARTRELAIRASLGASRARLARQLLTESLLLALVAGAGGLLLAVWGTGVLRAIVPPDLHVPRLDEVALDGRVLAFTLLLATATGLAFGCAPALAATRSGPGEALRGGARGAVGDGGVRLRSALVVGELALALVLLAGAGLLARSFVSLSGVDLGFDPRGALAARISLPALSYPDDAGRVAFFHDVEERIAALPGVQAVGAVSYLPLSGERSATGFVVIGRPPVPPGQEPAGDMRAVTPGYFRAMRIPLREGRGIEASDAATAPRVAVVGESLARRFWPGESAVGKRLAYDWDELVEVEVVGVVGDVRHAGPSETPFQEIYLPAAQFPYGTMTVVVRAPGDPRALAGSVRAQVKAADPAVPIAELHTLEELASTALAKSRLGAGLLAAFAGLGLLLAALGVYGLVAYGVGRRTRELGLRAALGARPGELVALVVRQGLGPVALGLVTGLAGALALTRLLAGLLHGVPATDPATFAGVALLLVACALLASWIPARRAARIDPCAALNAE